MRNKKFLISQGMYKNCREDTFWIIGNIYDDIVDNNYYLDEAILGKIDELRERATLLFPQVALKSSIVNRLRELFKDKNITTKKENNSLNNMDKDPIDNRGIYGIKINNEIIYVGMTTTSFRERWKTHISHINHPVEGELYLYKFLRKNSNYEFCILLDVNKINTQHIFTEKEIQIMELTFITYFQPKCNILGVKKDYFLYN